ncbi:MAG: SDR family oxidoreductase, partial [Planctomycetota bacterium]
GVSIAMQPKSTPPRSAVDTLVFGCGYVGLRVARNAAAEGRVVATTTRDPSKAEQLAAWGLRPVIADWHRPRGLDRLPVADRVLVAVSHDRRSGVSRYDSQVLGLRRLLDHLPNRPNVVYVSTTGVYHQSDGSWVDECSPARPRREGGKAHLRGERLIRSLGSEKPWTVLRLAGIYGPGRVPRIASVLDGTPIASPANGYLNLIHVEDAAAAVREAWTWQDSLSTSQRQTTDRLFVVGDDEPVLRRQFYEEIARQCGVPAPKFAEKSQKQVLSARSDSNKRIWNRRLKRLLVPKLKYPTHREGLLSVLSDFMDS